jgi:hypothetical protein
MNMCGGVEVNSPHVMIFYISAIPVLGFLYNLTLNTVKLVIVCNNHG